MNVIYLCALSFCSRMTEKLNFKTINLSCQWQTKEEALDVHQEDSGKASLGVY